MQDLAEWLARVLRRRETLPLPRAQEQGLAIRREGDPGAELATLDLRQPVAAVGLLSGLLRERLRDSPLREMTDRLADAVRAMENLLSGLLDLSRLEAKAIKQGDVAGRTRLLADFHVLLAQLAGNAVLAELLADLLARCSLIALMYQSTHSAEHSSGEHVELVDAIEAGDAQRATALMAAHLGHVEQALQIRPAARDLAAALNL